MPCLFRHIKKRHFKKDTSKKDISFFDMSKKICHFNFRHVHFPSRTAPLNKEIDVSSLVPLSHKIPHCCEIGKEIWPECIYVVSFSREGRGIFLLSIKIKNDLTE